MAGLKRSSKFNARIKGPSERVAEVKQHLKILWDQNGTRNILRE